MDYRYGKPTTRFFLWTGIPIRLLENALRVYVTSILLEALFKIPLFYGVMITSSLALVYTLIGGLIGVVITDALQAILLGVIVVVVAILAWSELGSIDSFMTQLPENYWTLFPGDGSMDLPMILGWVFVALFAWNANWSLVQRFVSVPTERDATKVSLMGGLAYYLIFPVLAIPPMLAAALLPELRGTDAVEQSYFLIAWQVLPQGLLGMLCFGIFGATITALNSELNVMSQVIVKDGIRKFTAGLSEKAELLVGRLVIVVLLVVCFAISLKIRDFGGAFTFLVTLLGLTTLPIFIPVLLGLVMKKANGLVCMAAFTAGFLTAIVLRFMVDAPMSVVIPANGAATFLVYWRLPYLLKAQKPSERTDLLFERLAVKDASQEHDVETKGVHGKLLFLTAVSLLLIALILFIGSWTPGGEVSLALSGVVVAALFVLMGGALLAYHKIKA